MHHFFSSAIRKALTSANARSRSTVTRGRACTRDARIAACTVEDGNERAAQESVGARRRSIERAVAFEIHPRAPQATVMNTWILGLAMLGMVAGAPTSKFHVNVTVDKDTNFAALHTYAWTSGWIFFSQSLDEQIVAAIDRELTSLGLTKQEGQPCDVLVTYGAVLRTNVDVSAKRRGNLVYPEYPIGTLVVLMVEPFSRRELLRARVEVPVDAEMAQLEQQIDRIVRRIFKHYPTRASASP
jgi:uncharacterized protein DUF4136